MPNPKDKLHLDEGLNGDWIKQSWDLPDDVTWVMHNCVTFGETDPKIIQKKLDEFLQTPTGRLMPKKMRAQLRNMGYKVSP